MLSYAVRCVMLLAFSYMLLGCSIKPMTGSKAQDYASLNEMIENEFSSQQRFLYVKRGKLQSREMMLENVSITVRDLRTYCEDVSRGNLVKVARKTLVPLIEDLNQYGGIFGCYRDSKGLWFVEHKKIERYKSRYTLGLHEVSESYAMSQKRLDERYRAKAERLRQERAEEERRLLAAWNAQVNIPKQIGQQVCSPDNYFGWVDSIHGDSIKVNVVGVARTKPLLYEFDDLQFFKGELFDFSYHEVDKLVWAKSADWGVCQFQ